MNGRMNKTVVGVALASALSTTPATAGDVVITGATASRPVSSPAPVSEGATLVAVRGGSRKDPGGSLYPPEALTPATETTPTLPSASRVDPQLTAALGSAAYILRTEAAGQAFRAAIRNAIGRHPSFHAQAAGLNETRANQRSARAALYPQLSARFNGDYVITRDFAEGTDNVVESLRPREQFTAGISASQLVYDGGATFQRIKSARARDEETKSAIDVRINDLALAVLSAHHDLSTHQALVALGDAFIRRHEEILGNAEERERLGAGSLADVTQTRARLASAKARVAEIRESKQLADVRYREFFGEAPTLLTRPSFKGLGPSTRDAAIAAALDAHPEIAAARARATASRADFKAAKGARRPEVRVSVDAVKFDIFDSGDDFDLRAGLNVNYNIFGGGARAAEIAAARARAQRENFNAEQTGQEVARDAAIAYERQRGAEARLEALKNAVINHDQTRNLVLERYQVSRGDLINVLQAENDYFEAGIAYLTGLANYDMSVYGLMEHTGDLLRYFSPQPEYNDVSIGGGDEG